MSKLEEIKNKYVTEFNPYSMSTVTDMRWLIEKLEKAIEMAEGYKNFHLMNYQEDAILNGKHVNSMLFEFGHRAREFLEELE